MFDMLVKSQGESEIVYLFLLLFLFSIIGVFIGDKV